MKSVDIRHANNFLPHEVLRFACSKHAHTPTLSNSVCACVVELLGKHKVASRTDVKLMDRHWLAMTDRHIKCLIFVSDSLTFQSKTLNYSWSCYTVAQLVSPWSVRVLSQFSSLELVTLVGKREHKNL